MVRVSISLPPDLVQFVHDRKLKLSTFIQEKLREEQKMNAKGIKEARKFIESFQNASAELIAKWEETVTQWNQDHSKSD